MWETQVRSLGQEDPHEKEMATHSTTCLENSMDGGAWWAIVHGVYRVKESDMTEGFHFHFSLSHLHNKKKAEQNEIQQLLLDPSQN